MRHGSISAASVQLHTVTRLSAATAVCRGGCVGRMRALQSNAHKKARLARGRPLRVTTCHPQLDLCPLRACTLRARGTRKACCLFGSLPNARSLSVSFRRALAQWRNAGRHMWAPVEPTLLGHETGCLHQRPTHGQSCLDRRLQSSVGARSRLLHACWALPLSFGDCGKWR